MEIKGIICANISGVSMPRDDAIAARGNLLDRTNKRFEGTMRDLLLNKTLSSMTRSEKTIKHRFHCAITCSPNYLTQGGIHLR